MNRGIALQLYTVRDRTSQDMLGTLRRIAAMGYRAVEFAGYGGLPAAEVAAALPDLGLTVLVAHVGLADLEARQAEVFADLHALGCEFAVVPWVPEARRADLEAVRGLAATLNTLGAAAQAEGLRLAYHNHAFEFTPMGGYDVGRAGGRNRPGARGARARHLLGGARGGEPRAAD